MARKTKPLTDTEIKAAKPKDADYQLYDGDGLTLLIKPSGRKLWQFRYYRPLTKQRTKQSFGAYPAVSLSDTRKFCQPRNPDLYCALINKLAIQRQRPHQPQTELYEFV